MSSPLDNIRLVLVEPTHPGNIGAVARAMKTMCLSRLYLVAPSRFPSAEATARASGADDLLHYARVVSTLPEAVSECALVVGASTRARALSGPVLTPDAVAAEVLTAARQGPVALVMGREHSGLTNEELDRCHRVVRIPANPDYSSLNLASAAQVLCYELFRAGQGGEGLARRAPGAEPATAEEMEGLYRHLQTTLVEIGFLDPTQPKQLMRRLRRLLNRAHPDRTELNILRGVLRAAGVAARDRSG